MNELAHSISLIFEPDSAPVVAVSGGMILFHNAAALSLFPTIECGQRASAILPASFLNCDEPVFVSTAQVNRQSLSANGVWYSGMLLLRMNLVPAKYVFSPEALTVSMRLELSKMQMALDLLNRSESIIGDSATRSGIAVLYHSYYKLLRSCENLALAEQLMQRSIVYRPVSIEPAKWLRNLISLVTESASSLGVNIQLSCSDELPAIAADPDLLEQMMLNLLSNSLRHCQPESSVSIRVSKKGANLQLIVDDNGAGFSSELLGTLFRRQLDNRPGQLSRSDQMGLFIVWGIAEMHGGSVTITNRRRGGASVRISLPAVRKNALKLYAPQSTYSSGKSAVVRILTAFADVLADEQFLPKTQD